MKRIIQILLGFVVLALPTTASAAIRTLYATSNYYEIISRNGLLGNKNTVETPTFTLDNQYKNDQLVNITWQMARGGMTILNKTIPPSIQAHTACMSRFNPMTQKFFQTHGICMSTALNGIQKRRLKTPTVIQ